MAFKVTEFKGSLAKGGGGARPALFKVGITHSISSKLSVDSLLVKAASIPAANIAPLTVNYAGRAYKWSGLRTFDNWTVTVINDEDFKIRNQMMEWMRQIAGKFDGSRSIAYGWPAEKSGSRNEGNATVTQLGTDGHAKQAYKFYNLWPTELGEIAVDWSSDAIQEYTIGFAYDYWGHGAPTSATSVVNASA